MTNISDHLQITDATNFRHINTQIFMINEDDMYTKHADYIQNKILQNITGIYISFLNVL